MSAFAMRRFATRNRPGRHAAGAAAPRLAGLGPVHQVLWGAPVVQRQVDPRRDPTRFDTFYRLLNFGNDSSAPKPEHETFLRDVILPMAKADSTLRLRFVGHADETGPASHNQTLSRARAKAVYALAQQLGIPRNQLLDVATPAGSGETEPMAGNTAVHGRAMNRRVEVFLTHQP